MNRCLWELTAALGFSGGGFGEGNECSKRWVQKREELVMKWTQNSRATTQLRGGTRTAEAVYGSTRDSDARVLGEIRCKRSRGVCEMDRGQECKCTWNESISKWTTKGFLNTLGPDGFWSFLKWKKSWNGLEKPNQTQP